MGVRLVLELYRGVIGQRCETLVYWKLNYAHVLYSTNEHIHGNATLYTRARTAPHTHPSLLWLVLYIHGSIPI